MVFRAVKSRWESCDKFVYTAVGTEHSHRSVFDSCQNISIIDYLFYLSFVLGIAVGGLMLRLKAKEFCNDPTFKASVGWYINWKRSHSITLWTKTTLAQHLPNYLEEQTVKFHRFVITARQRRGYPLSRIFNMDETPMRFKMPSSCTLDGWTYSGCTLSKTMTPKMRWMKNLIWKTTMSHKLTSSNVQFTTENKWLL